MAREPVKPCARRHILGAMPSLDRQRLVHLIHLQFPRRPRSPVTADTRGVAIPDSSMGPYRFRIGRIPPDGDSLAIPGCYDIIQSDAGSSSTVRTRMISLTPGPVSSCVSDGKKLDP